MSSILIRSRLLSFRDALSHTSMACLSPMLLSDHSLSIAKYLLSVRSTLGEASPPEQIGDVEIRFVPYQKDPKKVARFYQAADLYIHPARADTFPTTVLEALACGTPVVASAVGGIPEQIVEGRTGFLVPVGDARAMAGRVLDLLADEGLRLWMGRQAAEDAAQRFGLERMVREYLAFYEEMLDEHKLLLKSLELR